MCRFSSGTQAAPSETYAATNGTHAETSGTVAETSGLPSRIICPIRHPEEHKLIKSLKNFFSAILYLRAQSISP
jgi:hypothetical protein